MASSVIEVAEIVEVRRNCLRIVIEVAVVLEPIPPPRVEMIRVVYRVTSEVIEQCIEVEEARRWLLDEPLLHGHAQVLDDPAESVEVRDVTNIPANPPAVIRPGDVGQVPPV